MSTQPELDTSHGYSVVTADGREVFSDCTKVEAEHFASSLPVHVGAVVVAPVVIDGNEWFGPYRLPEDGDSIWVAILEHDGVSVHVDYAVAFLDFDGMMVRRFESDDYEHWPPKQMLKWTLCSTPDFYSCR